MFFIVNCDKIRVFPKQDNGLGITSEECSKTEYQLMLQIFAKYFLQRTILFS